MLLMGYFLFSDLPFTSEELCLQFPMPCWADSFAESVQSNQAGVVLTLRVAERICFQFLIYQF